MRKIVGDVPREGNGPVAEIFADVITAAVILQAIEIASRIVFDSIRSYGWAFILEKHFCCFFLRTFDVCKSRIWGASRRFHFIIIKWGCRRYDDIVSEHVWGAHIAAANQAAEGTQIVAHGCLSGEIPTTTSKTWTQEIFQKLEQLVNPDSSYSQWRTSVLPAQ